MNFIYKFTFKFWWPCNLAVLPHWQHYFPIDNVYAGSTSDLTLNDEFDILWGHGENLKVVALVVRNIEYKLLYDIGNL